MGTFIHGIGASENIDSSGERLIIAGMDISSLAVDGVFNFEHKSDLPDQVIGKVLKAKKIFSDKDCEDDHQLYFWNKCQVPYLYVMGELFDDYKESAKDIAGMFRYDSDKKAQNERNVMNFSIEGAKISKVGIDVTRSIARKVTITVLPCNKAAVAEMVAVKQKPKNDLDSLFKTEDVEIELFKSDTDGGASLPGATGLALSEKAKPTMKKEAPKLKIAPTLPDKPTTAAHHDQLADHHAGIAKNPKIDMKLRSASASKAGFHRKMAGKLGMKDSEARNKINAQEAKKTTMVGAPKASPTLFHPDMSGKMNPPGPIKKAEPNHHPKVPKWLAHADIAKQKPKQKLAATDTAKKLANAVENESMPKKTNAKGVPSTSVPPKQPKVQADKVPKMKQAPNAAKAKLPKVKKIPLMMKTMTAGSGLAAPDKLEGGAALAKQSTVGMPPTSGADPGAAKINKPLKSKDSKVGVARNSFLVKSQHLQRAEEEYAKWEKREQFETFMKSRMPHLTKGEITAIGQTMLLQKSVRMEKALSKISKK